MDKKCETVLYKIYSAAKKTSDYFVFSVNIELNGDEKKLVCEQIENMGYITKVSFNGRSSIQCQMTEKGVNYCEKSIDI